MLDPSSNVTAAIAGHAGAAPDRMAIEIGDKALAYRALEHAVAGLACRLAALPDGGIALHLPNGMALVLLSLAAARAGREAQVLDPDWSGEVARRVLGSLAPARLITADPRLAVPGAVLVDPQASADALAQALPEPLGRLPAPTDPEAAFYVGFTSGSTGEPKGYRRSHRSWLESFKGDAIEFGIGPADRVLAPGTLTHSLFLYAVVNGLHAGATVILCRRFKPSLAARLLRDHHATVLYGVPTQIAMLIEAAEERGLGPFPSLRLVLSSGSKWSDVALPRLRALAPGARFAEFYGASELSFVTVAKDDEAVPEGSVGRAFPGVAVTVRDRMGRVLPTGRRGLVFVESPLVFMGYAHGGEGDCRHAGAALSVGDMGFLDKGGYLHLLGRANRMIVSSGKNLYPEEIERVLEGHPAIAAAAAFGLPDARRGERVVAVVSLRRDVRRADLVAHARTALPLFKVPRIYGVAAEWPRTRSGKTDHAALRRAWCEGLCMVLP